MRGRRSWVVMVVLFAALVGGAWPLWSGRSADEVTVAWTPESPKCTGTQVRQHKAEPVFDAVAGMRCVIKVRVHNGGSLPVHLETATATFVGAKTGTVVSASNADASVLGGRDATYRLGRTLDPGRSGTFDIVTVFHPTGCNDRGRFWVDNWPTVELTSLGLTHMRAARETFSFHRNGRTPGCSAVD